MAIKVTNISIQSILKSDRFEPRYHHVFRKFEEYEKSSNHQILKFGDEKILRKITDGEHAGQTFVKKGIRFLKNSAIKDFSINLYDGFYITEQKHLEQKRSALKPLDILFTTIGHLGSTAIVPEAFGEANINQNVVKIEVNESFIDPYYLTAYLNANTTKKQIGALFTGNIHSIITYPKIKNIRIIVPDKVFQKSISKKYKAALDSEQSFHITIKKAKETFYQKIGINFSAIRKESSFSTSLQKIEKNDIWNPSFFYPLYVKTLKAIQANLQTISLGEIANIKKGDEVGSNQYVKYLDKKESDVPFIRTSDIFNYEVDQFPDFYISKEIYKDLKQDLKPGDIIFTKDGKIGMTAVITNNDKAILASGLARIRLKEESLKKYNITKEYLFTVLSLKETGLYPAIRRTVVASTIPHIREERLKEFEIPIIDKTHIDEITKLVKESFQFKDKKKCLLQEIRLEMDSFYNI